MNRQGQLISYRYDALDQLIGVEPFASPGTTRVYRGGRLATQLEGGQHHSLLEAGDHLLAQSTISGNRVVNTLLGCDQQRSILQSVTGDDIQRTAYTPYGGQPAEGGIQSLLGFNGEQPDPVTGCYLLGNGYRAYNPNLMRFHSPDSMSPFDSGGVNAYAYCVGDPINLSDPTGHFSWKRFLSIAISVAAIALTVVTLGTASALTVPFVVGAAISIGAEVLNVASELTSALAPDSKAGAILGYISMGLAVAAASPTVVTYAGKAAATRGGKALGKALGKVSKTGSSSVLNAVRQPLRPLTKGVQNTISVLGYLGASKPKWFEYVTYVGLAVKGGSITYDNIVPYVSPPASGESDQTRTTLDAFVRGDAEEESSGSWQGNIKPANLFAGQSQMQEIREF
jgi:RHS repeat-associated protein